MTELKQIYKCNVCGNIVEVLHTGVGELVCCGQPMELQKENTEDPKLGEKHVPIIETNNLGVIIKTGINPHPMEEKHHIEWIQIETKNGNYSRKFLKPGDKPEAKFPVKDNVEYEPEEVRIGELPLMIKSKTCNLARNSIEEKEEREISESEYNKELQNMQ